MARYAMVCDDCGHVVNVVELDASSDVGAPLGHSLVPDPDFQAGAGSIFNNGSNTFEPAPGLVPVTKEEAS